MPRILYVVPITVPVDGIVTPVLNPPPPSAVGVARVVVLVHVDVAQFQSRVTVSPGLYPTPVTVAPLPLAPLVGEIVSFGMILKVVLAKPLEVSRAPTLYVPVVAVPGACCPPARLPQGPGAAVAAPPEPRCPRHHGHGVPNDGLDRSQHRHTACMAQFERAPGVDGMKEALDRDAVGVEVRQELGQGDVDPQELLGERQVTGAADSTADNHAVARTVRLDAAITGPLRAGVDAKHLHASRESQGVTYLRYTMYPEDSPCL